MVEPGVTKRTNTYRDYVSTQLKLAGLSVKLHENQAVGKICVL